MPTDRSARSAREPPGIWWRRCGQRLPIVRNSPAGAHETQGVEWPSLIQDFVVINWLLLVSQFAPKASAEQVQGLTYSPVSAAQNAEDRLSYGFWEIFHTVVILGIIASIYIYFW